jgi:hypothetical protein
MFRARPYGLVVMMSIVWSLTILGSAKGSNSPLKSGLCFSLFMVHATSLAVNGFPEWNTTPLRKWKRRVSGSMRSHLSASLGSNCMSFVQRTSGSKTMCEYWSMPPESWT